MKGALTLVVLTSVFASPTEGLGICYDSNRVTPSAETIKQDMKLIKDLGFTAIRTYWTNGDNIGGIAMEAGLDVALGVPPEGPGAADEAIKLATSGPGPGKVRVIFVGNENLAPADKKTAPKGMFDLIGEIKAKAPGVKVGTVQRQTEFLDPNFAVSNMKELVAAVDVVGVNIHPVFGGSNSGQAGIESLNAQWENLKKLDDKYPGISGKLQLTEVGWPSAEKDNANFNIAHDFYKGYMEWSAKVSEDQYYFQAFDLPHRGAERGEGNFEKFFGIMDWDGKPKFPDVQVIGGGNKNPDPPKTDPPKTDPPSTEPPKTEPPKTEPPKTEPPKTEPPKTEPPKTEPPKTEPPKKTDPQTPSPPKTEPATVSPGSDEGDEDCDEFSMAGDDEDCDEFSMAGDKHPDGTPKPITSPTPNGGGGGGDADKPKPDETPQPTKPIDTPSPTKPPPPTTEAPSKAQVLTLHPIDDAHNPRAIKLPRGSPATPSPIDDNHGNVRQQPAGNGNPKGEPSNPPPTTYNPKVVPTKATDNNSNNNARQSTNNNSVRQSTRRLRQ